MKRILAKQKHYQSLLNTFRNHPEFAEGKLLVEKYIAELELRQRRIAAILSDILKPVSFFYSVKQNAEQQLNNEMLAFTRLGCLSASFTDDSSMYFIMKKYQMQLHKISAYKLHLNAIHVADMLQKVESSLAGPDFHTKKLPAFRKQAEEFGRQLDKLKDELFRRKALRKELASLIAGTNTLIRDVFDTSVSTCQETCSEFYREYMLLRHPKPRKRRMVRKVQPEINYANENVIPGNALIETAPVRVHQMDIPVLNKAVNTCASEKEVPDASFLKTEPEVPDGYMEKILELTGINLNSV